MMRNLPETEGYSDSKGLFPARKAIMQYCQLKKIPNVEIGDIYTGNGVSELITMSMQGLLNNGDEILMPSPDYPLWTAAANLAGGHPVHYMCDEAANWYPDMDDIRSKITDRTKGIVIINPNNPTGALYPREVLQEIVDIAREHQLIIFADEIYDRLVMDGEEHISIASLAPDLFCVTLNGLSKSHRIAGFRVGWMCLSGDKSCAKGYIEGLNMLASMRLCSNVPAQSIVPDSPRRLSEFPTSFCFPAEEFTNRGEFIYKALNPHSGYFRGEAESSFFIFPEDRYVHVQHSQRRAVCTGLPQTGKSSSGSWRRLQTGRSRTISAWFTFRGWESLRRPWKSWSIS